MTAAPPSRPAVYRPAADTLVSFGKMQLDYSRHSTDIFREELLNFLDASAMDFASKEIVKMMYGLSLIRVEWNVDLPRPIQRKLLQSFAR